MNPSSALALPNYRLDLQAILDEPRQRTNDDCALLMNSAAIVAATSLDGVDHISV